MNLLKMKCFVICILMTLADLVTWICNKQTKYKLSLISVGNKINEWPF